MWVSWEGLKTVKEYLFPVFCLSCRQEGVWLCGECMGQLDLTPQYVCAVCHADTENGSVCQSCRPVSALSRHVAVMRYEEDALIGSIIHTFKYQYAEDIFGVLEQLLVQFLYAHPDIFSGVDSIFPVPLHKKRFAERGFNQATAIAQVVAKEVGIPLVAQVLIRTRDTPHQARLDRAGRLDNVKNAFELKKPSIVEGKHVLLVDDVLTTGSTIQECARAVLEHGAREVSAFTLARG